MIQWCGPAVVGWALFCQSETLTARQFSISAASIITSSLKTKTVNIVNISHNSYSCSIFVKLFWKSATISCDICRISTHMRQRWWKVICGRIDDLKMARLYHHIIYIYDMLSEPGQEPVRKLDESKSGQMVFLKVKLAYSDACICQTMWNHANDSMKRLKRKTSVFLQGDIDDVWSSLLKTRKTKTNVTQNSELIWPIHWIVSRVGPCERARPQLSEYVWNIVVQMI